MKLLPVAVRPLATAMDLKIERWTAVTIVRVGTTKKYSDGWESAFSKGKKKATAAAATAKPAKKSAKKSVKKAAPKAAAKKKPAKKK